MRWQNWSLPRRLHAARGARAAPDQLSATASASARSSIAPASPRWWCRTPIPTANHFWKSAFDAGEYGLGTLANSLSSAATAWAHPLFRRPAADDRGRPDGAEERDLHARGGLRRPLEALRVPQRHVRGAPLAPARHLVLRNRRQLRLRLLLVPLPGRQHPARGQAHRHHPDGSRRPGQALPVGRHGGGGPRRSDAPALLQRAAAHDGRRRAQHRHRARVRAPPLGQRQPLRQRLRHDEPRPWPASATRRAKPTGGPGATGRSSIRTQRTASAIRPATSSSCSLPR